MNCKEIENKLFFYIDKNLQSAEQKEISIHLKKCERCAQKYVFLKKNYELIEIEKKEQVNPFIATQIIAKIQTKKEKSTFIKVFRPIMVAALIFVAVWLGNFASKSYSSLESKNLQAQNSSEIGNTEQFAINDISYEDYYFIASQ